MSRRGLSYEDLLEKLNHLLEDEWDYELPSNNIAPMKTRIL